MTITLFGIYIGYIIVDNPFSQIRTRPYNEIDNRLAEMKAELLEEIQEGNDPEDTPTPEEMQTGLAYLENGLSDLSPPGNLTEEQMAQFESERQSAISEFETIQMILKREDKSLVEKVDDAATHFNNLNHSLGELQSLEEEIRENLVPISNLEDKIIEEEDETPNFGFRVFGENSELCLEISNKAPTVIYFNIEISGGQSIFINGQTEFQYSGYLVRGREISKTCFTLQQKRGVDIEPRKQLDINVNYARRHRDIDHPRRQIQAVTLSPEIELS